MAQTSPGTGDDEGFSWAGLPSPALLRAALGVLLAAAAAVLGAFILGEYQFTGVTPVAAGVLFGLIVAEIAVEAGQRRGPGVAVSCAVLSAGGLLLAGWISAGEGLEPIPGGAWLAAGLGALAAGVRAWPRRRR